MVEVAAGLNALPTGYGWPAGVVTRARDLCLFQTPGVTFVMACDSNASIGSKPADFLRQSPEETGYSATKVPLMEVLAAGAAPMIVVDNLCCELEPYGRAILVGVARAAREAGEGITITGSDETNMPTVQTGIGVTVIGAAKPSDVLLGRAQAGDVVACLGVPKDGTQVRYREGEPDIASVSHVKVAAASGLVHELLPVGSRGVAYEVAQLAALAGLSWRLTPADLDLAISAGASTCFLASVAPAQANMLSQLTGLPMTIVAELGRESKPRSPGLGTGDEV